MKQEWIDRWVKALRSGEYKQGQGALRQLADDGKTKEYCCLGVLCELVAQDTDVGAFDAMNVFRPTGTAEYGQASAEVLPDCVLPIVGMRTRVGEFAVEHEPATFQDSLAEMNDSGATFVHIADYIEQHGHRL